MMLPQKMTVILILIGALGTVPKGFERWQEELEIGGRIECCIAMTMITYTNT